MKNVTIIMSIIVVFCWNVLLTIRYDELKQESREAILNVREDFGERLFKEGHDTENDFVVFLSRGKYPLEKRIEKNEKDMKLLLDHLNLTHQTTRQPSVVNELVERNNLEIGCLDHYCE